MTFSHASSDLPRRTIGGFQVLLSPDGPYLEVAERVRAAHRCGTLSVERGEILTIQPWHLYRVSLSLDACTYIGDVDLPHQGKQAPPTSIFDAQTAAVGQALAFAGLGDIRGVLARIGQADDLAQWEAERVQSDPRTYQVIAGIFTRMLNTIPHVEIAERLFQVHHLHMAFSMEHCEIVECGGVWMYRAHVLVGGQRFVGDANITDQVSPITCAQMTAVGNALALAGFGDVRSILERQGKAIPPLDAPPLLLSAEMAQQSARTGSEADRVPLEQRQRLQTLCQRLGREEPAWHQLGQEQAAQLLMTLHAEEAELFQAADGARNEVSSVPIAPPAVLPETLVDQAMLRQLKQRWRTLFHPAGDTAAQREAWKTFEAGVCGEAVSDFAMSAGQYEQLVLALDQAEQPSSSQKPAPAHIHTTTALRQAPRLPSPFSPTRKE